MVVASPSWAAVRGSGFEEEGLHLSLSLDVDGTSWLEVEVTLEALLHRCGHLDFAGARIEPGQFLYADANGVVIAGRDLEINFREG